ncbi:hypothetical protein LA080_002240 [Diaporthe eres]|nr:hypothetical protein LA080_002240 [Diaporthe eres]
MSYFKRLTRVRPGNVGSLGFLPLEVCNNIYTFLLADFDSRPELEFFEVSRDIHLLMIKKNRFVYVRSRGVPIYLLGADSLPIVTANEDHVRRFKGYVLEVTMTSHDEPPPPLPPSAHDHFDVMILARDLDMLCASLMGFNEGVPGFTDRLHLELNLGPVVTAGPRARDYKDLESLERYFSGKTQEEILQPFRDCLHEVHNVQVRGLVSADVASSICKAAALRRWDGPQQVLDDLTAQKETAMQYLEKKDSWRACSSWKGLASEINILRRDGFSRKALVYAAGDTLREAENAMTTGHWKEGFTWQPPRELHAKFHFRMARFLRLRGYRQDFEPAMTLLDQASLLCTDDSAITRERHLWMDWVSEPAVTA